MKVSFGTDAASPKTGQPLDVTWDSEKVINGHILIVGKSGMGKTHTLKNIMNQMFTQAANFRVHIMDVHGDIDIPGCSTVKFSEASPYGINPLSINPDPDFGGVRKRIQTFLAALNRTSRKLGTKQEAVMRSMLQDVYAANGFYADRPSSWRLDDGVQRKYPKKNPTLEDVVKFANFKLKSMFLGTSSRCVSTLEQLNKKSMQLLSKQKLLHGPNTATEIEVLQKDIKEIGTEAIALFSEYVTLIQTGTELSDLMKYDSKEVMKSVVERLENLQAIGIFRPQPPPFDLNNPIWRYDIRALATDEKKLFVNFMLEAIFLNSVQMGLESRIREVIVLDEAHLFFTDEPDQIVNVIAKEARKFGLAMFCASQSPTHFSDDFIANVGTKMVLGLDQMYWEGAGRKMKLEQKALEWIVPHRSLLVQINNKGELKNKFYWTHTPQNR